MTEWIIEAGCDHVWLRVTITLYLCLSVVVHISSHFLMGLFKFWFVGIAHLICAVTRIPSLFSFIPSLYPLPFNLNFLVSSLF